MCFPADEFNRESALMILKERAEFLIKKRVK